MYYKPDNLYPLKITKLRDLQIKNGTGPEIGHELNLYGQNHFCENRYKTTKNSLVRIKLLVEVANFVLLYLF